MITSTVPSAFTGKLARSAASLCPPLPAAACAAIGLSVRIAANSAKWKSQSLCRFWPVEFCLLVFISSNPEAFLRTHSALLLRNPRPPRPQRLLRSVSLRDCVRQELPGPHRGRLRVPLFSGTYQNLHHSLFIAIPRPE